VSQALDTCRFFLGVETEVFENADSLNGKRWGRRDADGVIMARGTQGYMKDWNDVHHAAAALRPVVGISEDAWNVANKVWVPAVAAASVALILDKSSDGEVRSPGGYVSISLRRPN